MNGTDYMKPPKMNEWNRLYEATCFVCGSKNVKGRPVFDQFCLGEKTWEFRCVRCGMEWYDDTVGPEGESDGGN